MPGPDLVLGCNRPPPRPRRYSFASSGARRPGLDHPRCAGRAVDARTSPGCCRGSPPLPLAMLATHTFPLAAVADAFAALGRGKDGLIHAALCYD